MKKLLLLLGAFLATGFVADIWCDFHITNGTNELVHIKLDTISSEDIDFDVKPGEKVSERSFPKQVREVYAWTNSGKEGFLNPDGLYADEIQVNYYYRKAPTESSSTVVNLSTGAGSAGGAAEPKLLIDSGNLLLRSIRSNETSVSQNKIKNYYLKC